MRKDWQRSPRPLGRRPGKTPWRSRRAAGTANGDPGTVRLYGLHPVEAALANPARKIRRLLATENAEHRLASAIEARAITAERARPHDLDRMLGSDAVHQGVMIEAEPLADPGLERLARRAAEGGPLVVLDHVTDPHNAGAVLRSAAVFGAAGLVMTRRHSPPLDGVLAKAASGALDLVPILLVQNLARTLLDLKARSFTVLGLDDEAQGALEEEPFIGRCAIVLGAEGKGLRELTAETCDRLIRIKTLGAMSSLNVSNAAAIALHAAALSRKRT